MGMLLIVIGLLVHQAESVVVKEYGKKYGKGGMFFNAAICLFAFVYFTVSESFSGEYVFYFPKELWGYGIVSGLCYATGFYTMYVALKTGSFGLTKLLSSFGTIIPIVYGITFLNEQPTRFTYFSVALILISVFLMNHNSNNGKSQISFKWFLCVVGTVLANAGIMIIAKSQQLVFDTKCSNEFLMISYALATFFLVIFGVFYERSQFKETVRTGALYGILAGIFNGVNNVLTLVVYMYVPISIVSPVRTALGLVISFILSVILYKEKFTKKQIISVILGIAAVVLINL